jgi:hypothetical protein
MAFPHSSDDLSGWGLKLLMPRLVAVPMPVPGPSLRSRRWLSIVPIAGKTRTMIGLILLPVVIPFILLVMFCAIFSGLVQSLTPCTSGFRCPEIPLASDGVPLIQLPPLHSPPHGAKRRTAGSPRPWGAGLAPTPATSQTLFLASDHGTTC